MSAGIVGGVSGLKITSPTNSGCGVALAAIAVHLGNLHLGCGMGA